MKPSSQLRLRSSVWIFTLTAACLLLAVPLAAQDGGRPLTGAVVTVEGTPLQATTGPRGTFRRYEGSPDRPVQEELYSWWSTIGLKLDL